MNEKQNRREFLKKSLTTGTGFVIGCSILSGCAAQNGKKDITAPAADAGEDYSQLAYCCINCSACDLFIATRDNNDELREKTAEKWEMYKAKDFKLENFYCYGCKTKKPGYFKEGCSVKKCVIQKGLSNCAHCDSFESCDKKLWTQLPWLKEKVIGMRAKLRS